MQRSEIDQIKVEQFAILMQKKCSVNAVSWVFLVKMICKSVRSQQFKR